MPATRRSSVSVRIASAASPGVSGANSDGSLPATSGGGGALTRRGAALAAAFALAGAGLAGAALGLDRAGLAGGDGLRAMGGTIHAAPAGGGPADGPGRRGD